MKFVTDTIETSQGTFDLNTGTYTIEVDVSCVKPELMDLLQRRGVPDELSKGCDNMHK